MRETSDNFTIDFWVRFDALGDYSLYHQRVDSSNYISIYYLSNSIYFGVFTAGAWDFLCYTPTFGVVDTWYHVEITRYGVTENDVYIFIDGISQALTWPTYISANYTMPNLAASLLIGQRNSDLYLNGRIDEFRISNGIARHIADFAVPTSEYQNADNLKIQRFEVNKEGETHQIKFSGNAPFEVKGYEIYVDPTDRI